MTGKTGILLKGKKIPPRSGGKGGRNRIRRRQKNNPDGSGRFHFEIQGNGMADIYQGGRLTCGSYASVGEREKGSQGRAGVPGIQGRQPRQEFFPGTKKRGAEPAGQTANSGRDKTGKCGDRKPQGRGTCKGFPQSGFRDLCGRIPAFLRKVLPDDPYPASPDISPGYARET